MKIINLLELAKVLPAEAGTHYEGGTSAEMEAEVGQ
jgi:hypothetical protein